MAYTKTNWEDAPSTATPLCAENLNKIEKGIYENSMDIALAGSNINTLSERTIAINTALSAKADKTELEDEITDLDETVTMKINLKADKATTLAGYGIEDAYTKTDVSKALSYKLDKKPFDTEPTKDSPNYITSGTVYNSVSKKADKATSLEGYGITDAYDKTYINRALKFKLDAKPFDTVPKENSPNYVTSGTVYNSVNSLRQTIAQNKADIEKSLANKYDAANNEIGSGELSPRQTIYEGSEGNFVYAKNGDAVTVSVNITSMLADKNYLQMSGLPFPSKTESKLASIAVYSTKNKLRNVRIDGSWIYISSPSDKFADGEKMNFIITYIIR